MKFYEIVNQVGALLQREGRVSYRALKREFDLDDEVLEDLKAELIEVKELAVDKDGRMLAWVEKGENKETAKREKGEESPESSIQSPESEEQKQTSTSTVLTLDPRRQTLDAAAERRQLTVMFIDLVGSTTLSHQLDPEDYHARVVAYQTACHQIIARYDGHIAQYLGDGVLVYFGYPIAHDEDAVRAVRSGLEIVTAVRQLAYTPPLQVRNGIHTGPVVVGEIGAGEHTERLALGETPNIAARIQGQAAPNEVVISTATYRLIEGLFTCEDRGQPELKGIEVPLTLYHVLKEGEAQNRFEAAVQTGLTPLVGREEELGLLRRRWEQAKASAGQVVLLSGEPGIGKSRLVLELKEHISAEGATCIAFRCSPYHQNSALYPIIDHLQRLLQFSRDDTPAAKLQKLQHTLSHYRFPQTDTFPLLAVLLSLPHPEGSPPITVSPQKQKEKTQAALVAWLREEAEKQPVYNTWEDLHWADPSTLEALTLVLDQVPTTRLLALLTFRPEFTPPWGNRSHLSQLTLSRLGHSQVEAMIERVTGSTALPHEVVQQIVSKTDGVPLFVEELTKSVVESVGATGRLPLQTLEIPATLQDSLMARLDRLGAAKEIAQLGATIGREFNYELLQTVSPLDEETLQRGLKQLVDAELMYQRGLTPQAHYLFKHALIQDTAYQSLLKSKRQQYHQQIAQQLEAQFAEAKETQPELVAHHYTEAGLIEQALPYWLKAGERASQRSAYVEAVAHLTKGLELLATLPNHPNRLQQELTLQVALGAALFPVKGYTAPDVEKTYSRARELCQQLGEIPQLFPVLWSLVVFYNNRAEYRASRELAEQLVRLAQSIQNAKLLSSAHGVLGWTLYSLGELTSARTLLEQGIALYDPQQPRGRDDPRVVCLSYASWTLWFLGYLDQGLQRSQEAVALARGLSNPFSLAYTLAHAAWLHLLRREGALARELAEEVITLSTDQGFPFWVVWGTRLRGSALAEQGYVEEGIEQMQQGMSALQAMGTEAARAIYLADLAAAYAKVERVAEGLDLLVEALARVEKTDGRVWEAELYRLKGELTLQQLKIKNAKLKITETQDPTASFQGAEVCFLKAIEIARRQQAKSLELRATMSLARLWQQQGKQHKAHNMLSGGYSWFTEGFDTKDLQEAKALLEDLGRKAKRGNGETDERKTS